jgi:cellobiose phosphorylase
VLGHLRRAIEFSLDRSGPHGLPCGLAADWNDCLQLGQRGESVFVAFQLRFALATYAEIGEAIGEKEESAWASARLAALDSDLARHAWDGEWFLRGFREDGTLFGSRANEEGRLFLNPQSWAVLSGHLAGERAAALLDRTHERLATEHGLVICDPPYEKTDIAVMKAALFNKGMKENGSVFCHTQGWAVIADALLGNGDRAYRTFRASLPAAHNGRAEVREIEPYVHCQSTHSRHSPRRGASRLPWLSGSAAWSYFAAAQYILGIRPEAGGLRIDPCIPSAWRSFRAERRFRGKTVRIEVLNPDGVQKGVASLTLNGEPVAGGVVPFDRLAEENTVHVVMGKA